MHQALSWTPELSLRIQRWIQVARDRAGREEWVTLWRTLSKMLRKVGLTQKLLAIWYLSHLLTKASLWPVAWLQADPQNPDTSQVSLTDQSVWGTGQVEGLWISPILIRTFPLSPELYIDLVHKNSSEEFQPNLALQPKQGKKQNSCFLRIKLPIYSIPIEDPSASR